MKKLLLISFLLLVTAGLHAQSFFYEDFSAGIPGGWTNIDNSGFNVLWRTTTTGALNQSTPVDETLNPIGTTASNGYLILDSDSAGIGTSQNSHLTTSAINCSGHNSVYLSFNEYFAQYGASTGIVSVSNDNINWVDYHHAEQGLAQDMGTANPYSLVLDISGTAANQSMVYIRFSYTGAFDYWWFIDDVELSEPAATDLAALSIENLSNEYTRVPVSQASGLTLSGKIKNVGLSVASGAGAVFEVVDSLTGVPIFTEPIVLPTMNPGDTITVVPSGTFNPLSSAKCYSRLSINFPNDLNTANNMIISQTMDVSDSVYQRDNGIDVNVQGIGAGPGEDGIAGQNFRVYNTGFITSVTFFLKDTFNLNPAGTPLFLTIHAQANDTTGPDPAILAVTDTLMLFPGTIPTGGSFFTLPLQGGSLTVVQGLYFIGFHEVDIMIPMAVSPAIFSPGSVWVHWNSIPSPPAFNGWANAEDFGFTITYMIRANFGVPPDNVSEVPFLQKPLVFPNPASDIITVRGPGNTEVTMVEIIDAVGKCILRMEPRGESEISFDISFLQPGIYLLFAEGKGFRGNQKICVSGHQ